MRKPAASRNTSKCTRWSRQPVLHGRVFDRRLPGNPGRSPQSVRRHRRRPRFRRRKTGRLSDRPRRRRRRRREVLQYVEYQKPDLLERVRKATETGIFKAPSRGSEARLLLEHYERGLNQLHLFNRKNRRCRSINRQNWSNVKGTKLNGANGSDQPIHPPALPAL